MSLVTAVFLFGVTEQFSERPDQDRCRRFQGAVGLLIGDSIG